MSTLYLQRFLAALVAFGVTQASAAPVTVNSDLSFRAVGQSLFADTGGAIQTERVRFHVLDEQLLPETRGRIVNTQTELPVSTLQVIWQRAINTCMAQGYTVPVINVRISPTQSECINGTIRRQYCVFPPQLGWDSCPDIGDNRREFVRDLGAGIGPQPTQPAERPYDIGVRVTGRADFQVGFEGTLTNDEGSVDLDFTTRARLAIDRDTAAPGDVVTVSTSHVPQQPFMMVSRYPFVDLALNMFAYATASVDAQYAGVDYQTGNQINQSRQIYSIDTRNNPQSVNGTVVFSNGERELFGVRLALTGIEARVLDATIPVVQNKIEYHLTWPPGGPEPERKAPKFQFPLSFSLADFMFSVPRLDTPAPLDFDCDMCSGPLRNFDPGDGTITSTTPTGTRELLGGITDGNGITVPWVDDGRQDGDLARVDVDVDVITAAAGVPLGVVLADPLGLFEAELNLLDVDLANFFSVDQRLHFDPNLHVELQFSPAVEVKGPQDADFALVSAKLVHVGEQLQFRQPDGSVRITPVYTLRNNQFVNDTKVLATVAIQGTMEQIKLGGIIPDLAASELGQELNFAWLQWTPQLADPAPISATDPAPWAMNGFSDVPIAALTVARALTNPGPGPGPVPPPGGGGGGGGGGGALEGFTLLGLLAFLVLRRCRRSRFSRVW